MLCSTSDSPLPPPPTHKSSFSPNLVKFFSIKVSVQPPPGEVLYAVAPAVNAVREHHQLLIYRASDCWWSRAGLETFCGTTGKPPGAAAHHA